MTLTEKQKADIEHAADLLSCHSVTQERVIRLDFLLTATALTEILMEADGSNNQTDLRDAEMGTRQTKPTGLDDADTGAEFQ